MAAVARELRAAHGDLTALTAPYAVLLGMWDPLANSLSVLDDLDAPTMRRIAEVLNPVDVDSVRDHYTSRGMDPAVYFYEQFLRACDATNARQRGVLYTPPEIVGFMVRGADWILRERLGQSLDDALVVDPCCGTGTFLRYIERSTHYRPRLLGMELIPAQAAIAKCLATSSTIICSDWLSQTSLDTNGRPLVILGNPPYSGHSSNAGKMANLMADYRNGLAERNSKWLQDDYVKFIRMAQHQIDLAGAGVVAFVTNHSFLFNPTFRVMRASLSRTFDEITALDLGGNVKRLNGAGENVFPIQMGVAVTFMAKTSQSPRCIVRHAEIQGNRADKLNTLAKTELAATNWTHVNHTGVFCAFTPHDDRLSKEFYSFPSLFEIFGTNGPGFVTSRDAFAIGFTRDEVLARISAIRDGVVSDAALRMEYAVGDLDIERARRVLQSDANWESRALEVLYRPFDRRWVYYSRAIMERPRLPFMENLMHDNIALAVGRAGQVTGSGEWDVVFCTDRPTDLNLFRRGGAKLFPRYVYRDGERLSNVTPDGIDHDVTFGYVYALMHSRAYRARYAEMLGMDYPRIPTPHDMPGLSRLATAGWEMLETHLMRSLCSSSQPSAVGVEGATIRIGGYDVPVKCLRERAGVDSDERNELISTAVERTIELREHIEEIIAEIPPWG